MTYQVLARKWRPQRFSELVGQEHVSKTLKNAIARQRVAHAYLFVGSRGVGKTTAARLLAKSLNCADLRDGEPCDRCESCLSIVNGSSLDVIEIDGASNNGVDNIRNLRETVKYMPSSGNYKIYIIDEVHMLSKSAWNALLKTLEEPPAHVKFIFATTEADKVLPTVVSRCQRFDFKFISPILIEQKLREIATAEKIFIDDKALAVIARAADGGMRDAQSIFDQMIAFCGGDNEAEKISETDVIDVFGMTSSIDLIKMIRLMYQDDVSNLLVLVNDLATKGRDLDRFFMELLGSLRNLLIAQCCQDYRTILEVNSEEINQLESLKAYSSSMTRIFLDSLMLAEGKLRSVLNKRVFLEVSLIRAMKEAHAVDINQVISAFTELKNSELPRQVIASVPAQKKNENLVSEIPTSQPVVVEAVVQKAQVTPQESSVIEVSIPPAESIPPVQQVAPIEVETTEPSVATVVAINEIAHQQVSPALDEEPLELIQNLPNEPQVLNLDPPLEVMPVVQDEPVIQVKPTDPIAIWHKAIETVESKENGFSVAQFMKTVKPVKFESGLFQVDLSDDFPVQLKNESKRLQAIDLIKKALQQVTGLYSIRFEYQEHVESFATVEEEAPIFQSSPIVKSRVLQNDFIQHTCQVFSGEVVDVRG